MPPKYYKKGYKSSKPRNDILKNVDATYLIIVESPSKCAKIESYLGIDYQCIASCGHIRTITGLKSIDTKDTFAPKFTMLKDKIEHVDKMRGAISMFSKKNIILATDDDREGEAIAWHLCEVFSLDVNTTKRILFREITKTALQEAVENPTLVNQKLVNAQIARQVLDVVVGYKISPYLWKYLYNDKSNSLSAGRCQTPALRLVYDNEEENKKSVIEEKYKLYGLFFTHDYQFTLNKCLKTKEDVLSFLEKSKEHKHVLSIGSPKTSVRTAPKPFSTSRLLQVANNTLHYSPKDTMNLCQQLYQAGYITYMRTESQQYSKVFIEVAKKYIMNKWNDEKLVGNTEDIENKDSKNPHEAIRVTQLSAIAIQSENSRLKAMYNLIWKNTVESCMSDAKIKVTDVKISAPNEMNYIYTVEEPILLGWKKIGDERAKEEPYKKVGSLLFFKTSELREVKYNSIHSEMTFTNKQSHYTEAGLINKLEGMGIGRPSTFASIVDTLQQRGYVNREDIEGKSILCEEYSLQGSQIIKKEIKKQMGNEKNKLTIQPLGVLILEFLIKYYDTMFSYEYTKNMELQLDDISNGVLNEWSLICKNCYNEIKELSKPIDNISKQTYEIDEKHVLLFEKYGPVISYKENNENKFLSVKKDMNLDLEKLKQKEYTLDDLVEVREYALGTYNEKEVIIKRGPYGLYVEYENKKIGIKNVLKSIDEITIDDVIELINADEPDKEERNVLRVVNENTSIRKGKFGAYVYYKRPNMKKPEFYNLKKFKGGYLECEKELLEEWLYETYKVKITK